VPDLDEVLSTSFLDGLGTWPIEVLRAKRDQATALETTLSYMRRVVQGRLDIVLAERRRRGSHGDPAPVEALLAQLPSILADRVHAPGRGRLAPLLGPGELPPELARSLEATLPANALSSVPEIADEDLDQAASRLELLERELSAQRRALFNVIDRLQNELVRRYRSGEATVESLLP
jgi:hypothetical protein